MLAQAFYQYATTYSFAGDNVSAKRYYLKAMKMLASNPYSYLRGVILIRICDFNNIKHNQSTEDLNYIYEAIRIFEKIKSPKGLAMAYGMLEGAYGMRWDGEIISNPRLADSLFYYCRIERKYAEQARDSAFIVDSYVREGYLHSRLANNKKGILMLKKSLQIANMMHNYTARIRSLLSLADISLHVNQTDSAWYYLKTVQKIYEKNGYQQFFIYRHLQQSILSYYIAVKDWALAFNQTNLVNQLLNDSDFTKLDKTTYLVQQELEVEHAALMLDLQKHELEINNKLVRTQRTFITITALLLAAATILSILFFRLFRKNQRTSNLNEQLVREQSHRIMNNLQMISSLLHLQEIGLPNSSARKAVEDSRLLIESMAIIQRKLYDSNSLSEIDLPEFLTELTSVILQAYGFLAIKPVYLLDPIKLDADKTIPIGLIVTEVVTNACKYAFPNNPNPVLLISCKKSDDAILHTVSDNGQGISMRDEYSTDETLTSIKSKKSSFGMQLIKLQTRQLYGHSKFLSEDGTTFTLEFSI